MSNETVEGVIAEILSETDVVITIGARDGVREGDKFAVYATTPLPIHDPRTDELLGSIDREKVRVEATHVQERFAVCTAYGTNRSVYEPASQSFTFKIPSVWNQDRQELEAATNGRSRPKPLPPEELYVQIGDRVVRVEQASKTPVFR